MAITILPLMGSEAEHQVIVLVEAGSVVTAAKDGAVKTAEEKLGLYYLGGLSAGTWTVTASKGTGSASSDVIITEGGDTQILTLSYQLYPSDFDLSGYGTKGTDYQVVSDDDVEIPEDQWGSAKNWKIRLLTSGTLKAGKAGKIDVFGVGGGGGSVPIVEGKQETYSGGPGYSATETVEITAADYAVTIGAGGSGGTNSGSSGGTTTAFGVTANGGEGATGSANGSGGTATGEFGEASLRTYCQIPANYTACQPNTGDGGALAAKYTTGNSGGSGIVIIRNARG